MSAAGMRIGIFSAYYVPSYRGGGTIRTLAALVASAPTRFAIRVVTSDRDLGEDARLGVEANRWVRVDKASVFYASADSLRAYLRALVALRRERPEVIYLNSLFDPRFSIVPLILARAGWLRATILLAPRGELNPGAVRIKSAKKAIYLATARAFGLHRGVQWHASSATEAEYIRRRFPSARPLIREDETLLPRIATVAEQRKPGPFRAVFLGRVVPVKGLDILLSSLAQVSAEFMLDIIGTHEDPGYVDECKRLAAVLPPSIRVRFLEPLLPDEVPQALSAYDAMTLPTHGENFGHVIAEALSRGLPVFTTANTPWTTVLESGGGGIITPNDSASWAARVHILASCSDAEIASMKSRAARAYENWASDQTAPHIFEQLADRVRNEDPRLGQ